MKITIPEYVDQYDLNENELVFVSLLMYFVRNTGRDTEFIFLADDVKRILGFTRDNKSKSRKGTVELSVHGPWQQRLRKVCRIALYDFYNWGFQLHNFEEHLHKNGALKTKTVRLRNKQSIITYCYLVGRLTDSNVIEDVKVGAKLKYNADYTTTKAPKLMDYFFYDTFEI